MKPVQEQSVVTGWLKTLGQLQQENIFLKNKVADLLQYDINRDMLEKLENFQNIFLAKDTVLSLLRHEISLLKNDNNSKNGIADKKGTLQKDMQLIQKEFVRLKKDFNQYVVDITQR